MSAAVTFDFDAVSFDIDGTLYALGRFKRQLVWRHLFELRTWIAMEHVRKQVRADGAPFDDMDAHLKRLISEDIGEPFEVVSDRVDRMLGQDWPRMLARQGPLAGVVELLDALVEAQVPFVALSDYPGEKKLEGLGLLEYPFVEIIDATACGALKPHPVSFERAARALALPPGRVLHVGDSLVLDVEGARRAGMQSALVGKGKDRGADDPAPDLHFVSMAAFSSSLRASLKAKTEEAEP